MEPFSLFKFWRTAGSVDADSLNNANKIDVRSRAPETDDDSDSDIDSDDDSFFDLVLTRTAPDCSNDGEEEDSIGNLIELEPPLKTNKSSAADSSSSSKPQSPISLLRSAPKFRVFLLGFRKSKSEDHIKDEASKPTTKHQNQKPTEIHSSNDQKSKRFPVKYCKGEELSIGSLFTRDNSLRSKLQRERSVDFSVEEPTSKPLPKDHVPKYLKLIKPLYNRASKRYTTSDSDKLRFPNWDQFSTVSPLSSPSTLPPTSPRKLSEERRGNRGTGFRVVIKHLGKSRSASSTVGVALSPASRRDDSLLLQHDGIQSAILHCKRSYNASSIGKDCSAMLRTSMEKSNNQTTDFHLSSDRNRCSSI